MALINDHFLKLPANYLFDDIAKKVNIFKALHPKVRLISLGIGDVTLPLAPAVIEALHHATEEMGAADSFRGYGPEQGYAFLRDAILKHDFTNRGIHLDRDEIFINDGAKSDTGNFQELIRWDNSIAVTDPVYPVYIDSNVMIGRAGVKGEDGRWSNVIYLPCTAENKFIPELPRQRVDVVYLCYPNNPTGTTLNRDQLKQWVNYAIKNDALIFYDAAYEAYIQHDDIPHSIYEIKGARKVAVEFHSYSKTAGFTGIRCGYTVVPKEVTAATLTGERVPLNPLWYRRQCTKFNGVSYLSQRAAEAIYTPDGQEQVHQAIGYYLQNASHMKQVLRSIGLQVYGGDDAPYLWVQTPEGMSSWRFFEQMLYNAHVVCTPGVGFGPSGEGYVRLTAFNSHELTEEALRRIERFC